jgi:hypothetical protein
VRETASTQVPSGQLVDTKVTNRADISHLRSDIQQSSVCCQWDYNPVPIREETTPESPAELFGIRLSLLIWRDNRVLTHSPSAALRVSFVRSKAHSTRAERFIWSRHYIRSIATSTLHIHSIDPTSPAVFTPHIFVLFARRTPGRVDVQEFPEFSRQSRHDTADKLQLGRQYRTSFVLGTGCPEAYAEAQ